jgi:2-iminobutanoate/2-iminopropanoate deaminase
VDFLALNKGSKRARLTSDVVVIDGWATIAGLQPIDLTDDRVALPESIEAQTAKVLANLEVLLRAAGLGKEHVVSVRVSLVDLPRLYERMNAAYVGFFPPERLPARSCVGVAALSRSALIEIDVLARRPPA